jgi:hypothetical protein
MNGFVSQLKTQQSIRAAGKWLPPLIVGYGFALQKSLTKLSSCPLTFRGYFQTIFRTVVKSHY